MNFLMSFISIIISCYSHATNSINKKITTKVDQAFQDESIIEQTSQLYYIDDQLYINPIHNESIEQFIKNIKESTGVEIYLLNPEDFKLGSQDDTM